MQFIDLSVQQKRIRASIEERIRKVLDHGQYVSGPEIQELEGCLANYVGVRYAIACASGTDALLMALLAHSVGPGDLILTTPFTFIATAGVIGLLGATPVFVDVDAETFNMDSHRLEETIIALSRGGASDVPLPRPNPAGALPRGIIPVDLFGLPADYEPINAIARKHGLFVIEDAAQSFGAAYSNKMTCSLADVGCTSFFPAKPLACYGDGGMCFTDNGQLAEKLRSIRVHGMGRDKYENVRIGINGRLDTIQAAILAAKFEIFPEEVILRQEVASRYAALFRQKMSGKNPLRFQRIPADRVSVWGQYSILAPDTDERSAILEGLRKIGVPSAVYYPTPLHLQQAFHWLGYRPGDFPVSEDLAGRIFSVPMHPYLEESQQEMIVEGICGSCQN
ncbi:MAG: DegT/DnrJ/EryC1/StrS family aminotransferase [Desulfobacteraceae bacterium]|nr:DegT/DnrJ/EryC1/StrS family aminotransferase [Desulfobacteraceae bacterium]